MTQQAAQLLKQLNRNLNIAREKASPDLPARHAAGVKALIQLTQAFNASKGNLFRAIPMENDTVSVNVDDGGKDVTLVMLRVVGPIVEMLLPVVVGSEWCRLRLDYDAHSQEFVGAVDDLMALIAKEIGIWIDAIYG